MWFFLLTFAVGLRRQGKLAPAWRLDIANSGVCVRRSTITQYLESDLAFVERSMSEEGMLYFFENDGDAASRGLGRHTLPASPSCVCATSPTAA